jgi:hypothetical protein
MPHESQRSTDQLQLVLAYQFMKPRMHLSRNTIDVAFPTPSSHEENVRRFFLENTVEQHLGRGLMRIVQNP